MTSKERFTRMFDHREADRIPIIDSPWKTTIERWQREGMPNEINFADYFGLDKTAFISIDNSPRYEEKVLEETDEYIIKTTKWGATMKNWKHASSTPEFLDFTIKDPDSWQKAKKRMMPSRDRIDWKYLKENYKTWRSQGYWIQGEPWFGFDVTHAWTVGTERLLMAMVTDPEWVVDMFNHFLDVSLELLDLIWEQGYKFDCIFWPDDMGYKNTTFFSVEMYRKLLKPVHRRAIDWAHAKGIKTHLHSCGKINSLVPELIEIGLDGLNPMEVKAGMDPIYLKKTYGKQLLLHGGINAMLWDNPEKVQTEMERVIPIMKESGGYIFSSDHSVPDSVSLEDFRNIVDRAKKLGTY
ncbi:MAG: uroporphyrinogen decarboxylase family protein [Planctomycetota bacterium]